MERVSKNTGNPNHPRQGKVVAREALSKHIGVADDSLQELAHIGGSSTDVPKKPGQLGFMRATLMEGAEAISKVRGPFL